ncbi:MAG: hypothetical protein ACXVRG_01835 [Gaiellaceae bacterium]
MSKRKILVAAAALAALVVAAVAGAIATGRSHATAKGAQMVYRPSLPTQLVKGHVADVLLHGREGGREADAGGAEDPAAQAYADQAFPFSGIGIAQTRAAEHAAAKLKGKGPKHGGPWQEVGPFTLDVQSLATQTFNRPTQWSGRVTALAIDPSCDKKGPRCTLYVAAAGGGVWRTDDALAKDQHWTPISGDIPSTAIGSLLIDPSDPSGKTIYAGTGEESGSSDSEAGIGLYKSTDRGNHWALVPGSFAVSNNRSIGAVSVDPSNSNHILIGTDVARHGASSVNGGRFTPPNAPKLAVYESTDGGASFHEVLSRPGDSVDPGSPNGSDFFRGGVTDIQYDPTHAGTLYATITDYGLFRSSDNGATWTQIFTGQPDPEGFGIRYELAPTTLANGKTRIYLAEGLNEFTDPVTDNPNPDSASRLLRTDDATGAATFTNLSTSDETQPGFGSFDFCEAQCSYDMFVSTPAGHPDTVWLGGSMQYGELPPYAGADRSDGRAVVRSTDGGVSWNDMTGDNRTDFEDQHPDLHAIAFDPADPNVAFIGSDGGMIRTDGKFGNASGQCASRGLTGNDLANCQAWLSQVPNRLITMNEGLRTLQFENIAVDPQNPLTDLLGGTQDNATPAYQGSQQGEWVNTMSGDGGNSGIDVKNPNLRYHTYYGPQGDVNFHGNNQNTWDWYMDPLIYSGEAASFYVPFQADPVVSKTAYVGLTHVWRTQDGGGDPSFLDNHCFTDGGPKGDLLFTGACGDWTALGAPGGGHSLTGTFYGATRTGDYLTQVTRAPSNSNTLWVSTRRGRVFVSQNANATGHVSDFQDPFGAGVTLHSEDDVTFTRIDDGESAHPVTPQRFPSGISVDPTNPNHAIISYSGYDAYATAVGTPTGHVFDVTYNPSTHTASWTNISYDLGDQPITGVQLDSATGDIYAGTDFGVWELAHGTTSWAPAASGLPTVAVYGLQLAGGKKASDRVLYAATHGRGVWRLALPDVKH